MREVKMIFVWLYLFEALWQQLASLSLKAKFKTGCNTLSLSTLPPKLSPMTRPTSKSQFLPHPHYFSCLFLSWPPWSSSSDIGNFWYDQPQLQKATDVLAGISWLPPPFPLDPPPHLQHWLLLPRFDTFRYIWGYLGTFAHIWFLFCIFECFWVFDTIGRKSIWNIFCLWNKCINIWTI